MPGLFYLLSRGLIPAAIFAGLYHEDLLRTHLLLWALVCGTGAELLLRSQVFIKQQGAEELSKGLFDLVRWYQNLTLEVAGSRVAEGNQRFIKKHLPKNVAFSDLCQRVETNSEALVDEGKKLNIKVMVQGLKSDFEKQKQDRPEEAEQIQSHKLAYSLKGIVGERVFKTLFKEP